MDALRAKRLKQQHLNWRASLHMTFEVLGLPGGDRRQQQSCLAEPSGGQDPLGAVDLDSKIALDYRIALDSKVSLDSLKSDR